MSPAIVSLRGRRSKGQVKGWGIGARAQIPFPLPLLTPATQANDRWNPASNRV